MKTFSLFFWVAVVSSLIGCSTTTSSWAPFPQNKELTSFADRWKLASRSGADIVTLQHTLVEYRDEIYAAAAERSRLEWDSTGLTTYGGLAAVVGALADKTGLLNTGVALATFGLTNSSRYKFPQQTQIYVSALKRIACITGKVNSISDSTLNLAKSADDSISADAAKNFINSVITSVDYVRIEYTNGLLGLAPTVPTRDELLAFAGAFRAPVGAVAGIMSADQVASNRAGDIVKSLVIEIQNCSKF